MRQRWLLRKAILAPLTPAHTGAELEQVSECNVNAVPNTDGLHLSQHLELVAIGCYDACRVPAAVMEELKYFAKGRKACFLGC